MNFPALQSLEAIQAIAPTEAMVLIGHAVFLGFVLMGVTAVSMAITSNRFSAGKSERTRPSEIVLNAANVLYLCIGMSGVMLLVNNSIARAFAIGAAISLVRFRVKVDSKTLGMSLFFGVLVGMACGVAHPQIAYGMALVFSVLQFIVLAFSALADKCAPAPRAVEILQSSPSPNL